MAIPKRKLPQIKRGDVLTTQGGTSFIAISDDVVVFVRACTELENWWCGEFDKTFVLSVFRDMWVGHTRPPRPDVLLVDYISDHATRMVFARSLVSRARFYFYKFSRKLAFIYRRGVSK